MVGAVKHLTIEHQAGTDVLDLNNCTLGEGLIAVLEPVKTLGLIGGFLFRLFLLVGFRLGNRAGRHQFAQGSCVGNAVDRQLIGTLEFADRSERTVAVVAVQRIGVIAQLLQFVLQSLDLGALIALLEGLGGVQFHRRIALGSHGVIRIQLFKGAFTADAVSSQTVLLLEFLHSGHSAVAVIAVAAAAVVAQFLQTLLDLLDRIALGALLQGTVILGLFLGFFLLGLIVGADGRGSIQLLQGSSTGNAVLGQAVLLLEGLYRLNRTVAVAAVNAVLIVAQLLQALLQLLDLAALGALLQGIIFLDSFFLLNLRRSLTVGVDGGGGIQLLQGSSTGNTVLSQAVLLLESLHRVDSHIAVIAVDGVLVIAQFLQALLQLLDRISLGALLQGTVVSLDFFLLFLSNGLSVGSNCVGSIQLLQRRLVNLAVLGQAVLFLEGLHGINGHVAVIAVASAAVVAQLRQTLLNLLDGSALVALLKRIVIGDAHVIFIYIAGIIAVGHLIPVAGLAQHFQTLTVAQQQERFTVAGSLLAQIQAGCGYLGSISQCSTGKQHQDNCHQASQNALFAHVDHRYNPFRTSIYYIFVLLSMHYSVIITFSS